MVPLAEADTAQLLQLLADTARPSNNLVQVPADFLPQLTKRAIAANTRLRPLLGQVGRDAELVTQEVALLARLLYRLHNRFRNEPGYRALRILEKSATKLLSSCYLKSVTNLTSFLPLNFSVRPHLPPRPLGQHALLHLWGGWKLVNRVLDCCKSAGVSAMQRLVLGHHWTVASQALAVVSRIWVVCCNTASLLANSLRYLATIVETLLGPDYIPKELWSRLVGSISDEEADHKPDRESSSGKSLDRIDPCLEYGTQIKRMETVELPAAENDEKSVNPVAERLANNTPSPLQLQELINKLRDVRQRQDLKTFLAAETDRRKVSRKTAATRRLSQEEWRQLKTKLVDNFSDKTPNKSVKLCRKLVCEAVGSRAGSSTPVVSSAAAPDDDKQNVPRQLQPPSLAATSGKGAADDLESQLKLIKSLADLKTFLRTETQVRKVSKRTSCTRALSQERWKELKLQVVGQFNEKTPNKSVKASRSLIRDAVLQQNL